jgi:hypothetical protein
VQWQWHPVIATRVEPATSAAVRLQIPHGTHIILKIDGTLNISDIGTKLQDYATFMRHRVILHTPKFLPEGMSKLINRSVMTPGGHFVSLMQTPKHRLLKLLMDRSDTRIT